ncbi:MAG TPA: 30S ribosomal protein S17 [bacterium]|nr:30S ribosomal protein S17 [bacterium]
MSAETQPNRKEGRTKTAVVVSRNMDKTAVVAIERVVKHPLYQKLVRRRSKFKVHDPKNETHKGDVVLVAETRPISGGKHWRLVKILRKAVQVEEAQV